MMLVILAAAPALASGPALGPPEEPAAAQACVPSATALCLQGNRFQIRAQWRTPDGASGAARGVKLTGDTGYFWFFQNSNVEFVLKVLNGCSLSNRFWVFAGGLTNVQVDITVVDTATGAMKTYRNPQNTAFRPIQDTDAFAACGVHTAADTMAFKPSGAALRAASPVLLLQQNRFEVSATWRTPHGETGNAQPVRLTDETGYFWFFDPNNVEMVLKVLDGCTLSNHFWVFAGGLTNVAVDVTVKDLATGVVTTYHNPQNTAFAPIQDTSAFNTCATSGLPPDPGDAGKLTLEGIDSDHDGIRDDLQRYIVLTYGSSPVTVNALEQAVKTVQAEILDAGSHQQAVDDATAMIRNIECLSAVRPGDGGAVGSALVAKALNTEARGLAYLRFSDQLGGEVFPLRARSQWSASCGFAATTTADGQPLLEAGIGKTICAPSNGVAVYFVNGVNTSPEKAAEDLAVLMTGAGSVLTAEELANSDFAVAYNPSNGLTLDLWVSVKQRLENDFERFYRFLSNLAPMPDFMQGAYKTQATLIDVEALLTSPTLVRHILLYQNDILEGRKVVLVSHSQGNFYANRSFTTLDSTQRRSLGIVSVANPDSQVADGRPYTTLTTDLLIRAIPGALSPTTSNGTGFSLNDPLGHGFIESYMADGTNSRARILGHLKNAVETVESPAPGATDGIITITLTWGAEPDVDLHVFEPDGTHVYYSNRSGNSGFLDVDDVSSYGPEHYYAACSSLQTGVYRVGVNYYYGNGPEVATVQIRAGLLVRTFQIPLSQSVGSAGNANPIPVANIIVTGNAQDGYDFQVQ